MSRVFVVALVALALLAPSYASAGEVFPWECGPCKELHKAPRKERPSPACNRFTFDATSSYDPNNKKLSYVWDFGDGTTSEDPVVTHVYEKGGTYTVTLRVTDNSGLECQTSTTTQTVTVNTAPVCAFNAPEATCVGDTVTFDASATTDDPSQELTYLWDFGDGTSGEGKTVTKTYEKSGRFMVTLMVNDNAKTVCSQSRCQKEIMIGSLTTVNAGEDIQMCVPAGQDYQVAFSGTGSAKKDMVYTWDFGDGETATGRSVTHVYKKGGNYVATLQANDGQGLPCSIASDQVNVMLSKQPVASFAAEDVVCLGSSVNFDASASNDPDGNGLSYTWDFGDGETAQGAKVAHVYKESGNYKVLLTVDNGKGTRCSADTVAQYVSVNAAPKAMLSNVDSACVGEEVMFDASGSEGRGLTYTWDFGDGTTKQAGSRTSHVYEKGGQYTVRVIADDKKGTPCSSDTTTSSIKVNTPPVANAGPNLVCCVGVQTSFDGSGSTDADGNSLTYLWNFGDGTTAEGAKVTHAFAKGGTYRVTLTVDDGTGTSCSKSTSSFMANVNDEPVAIIKVR